MLHKDNTPACNARLRCSNYDAISVADNSALLGGLVLWPLEISAPDSIGIEGGAQSLDYYST